MATLQTGPNATELARGQTILRTLRVAVLCLAWTAGGNGLAFADAPTTEQQARRSHAIASRLMSPFCPGSTIASCSSPRAEKWRADIQQWVKEGKNEAEIRARLQARAPGHDLSGSPSSRLGWWLPTLLAIGAVGLLVLLLKRFARAHPVAQAGESEPAAPHLEEELDRELSRLDD